MKLAYLLAAVSVTALTVTACDVPAADKPAATPAAAATPPPAPPPPAADTTPMIPGLSQAYATEADATAACTATTPKIPKEVCDCVIKGTVKVVGIEGLYDWSYKWLVNQDAAERMRADRWFTAKAIDKDKQKKLVAETGKCFVR